MIENFKNVLVLAPHTDDGELGAGGTIAKLVAGGSKVTYVAFSTAAASVPEGFPSDVLKTEVKSATAALGIKAENLVIFDYEVRRLGFHRQDILEKLIELRQQNAFDLVLTPSLQDVHQDHATVAMETIRAFKNITILGYELIWNNLSFDTKCFVELDHECLQRKCAALKMYTSQGARRYLSEDFTYSLAKARGGQVDRSYAECFEVIRLFM